MWYGLWCQESCNLSGTDINHRLFGMVTSLACTKTSSFVLSTKKQRQTIWRKVTELMLSGKNSRRWQDWQIPMMQIKKWRALWNDDTKNVPWSASKQVMHDNNSHRDWSRKVVKCTDPWFCNTLRKKKKKKDEPIKRGNIFSKVRFNTPEKESPPNADTHLCQVKKMRAGTITARREKGERAWRWNHQLSLKLIPGSLSGIQVHSQLLQPIKCDLNKPTYYDTCTYQNTFPNMETHGCTRRPRQETCPTWSDWCFKNNSGYMSGEWCWSSKWRQQNALYIRASGGKKMSRLNTIAAATAYVKNRDEHDAEPGGLPSSFHLSYLK